jgi:hypothetical protein
MTHETGPTRRPAAVCQDVSIVPPAADRMRRVELAAGRLPDGRAWQLVGWRSP